jgi:hypothetical protein
MAKLPHSSTRRGFSTHNSVGTDSLANPNMTGGSQPGMLELKEADGTPHYLWVDDNGDLRIHTAIPTDPSAAGAEGVVVGTQT